MKILITGAGGMLASDLVLALENSHSLAAFNHRVLDISNRDAIAIAVRETKPELIINCAAYTKVDACEDVGYAAAYAANAHGPGYLAEAAREADATILHVSTDYVFDGKKGAPYVENDTTNPLSVYGKSKLEGENNIRKYARHYIVRTQWLYGHSGANFVKTMLTLAKTHDKITVVGDQFGSPTNTYDLAQAIKELITTEAYGTYHITNSGYTSWYGFTKEIFSLAEVTTEILPCPTSDFPRPATRPAFAPLENKNWLSLGKPALRHYREALIQYLN